MISTVLALALALLVSRMNFMRSLDTQPSYSQFMALLVVLLFALGHFMPALIGVVAIISAHGSKVLLAWVNTKSATFSETVTAKLGLSRRNAEEGFEEPEK